MKDLHCSEGYLHEGPFALYLWKSSDWYRGKRYDNRSVLCKKCAERVGAWKLPAKEEIEEAFRPILDDVKNAIEEGD